MKFNVDKYTEPASWVNWFRATLGANVYAKDHITTLQDYTEGLGALLITWINLNPNMDK